MLTAAKMYNSVKQKNKPKKAIYQDINSSKSKLFADVPPSIKLTINDFQANGNLRQNRALCMTTIIDPAYKKYSKLQHTFTKFQMKTDVLLLKVMVRNKFAIYSTQQQYIESQMSTKHQTEIYNRSLEMSKVINAWINKFESVAFRKMQSSQNEALRLSQNKLNVEFKEAVAEHQKVLMEVRVAFRRFNWMISLINYFDVIEPLELSPVENTVLKVPNNLSDLNLEFHNLEDINRALNTVLTYTNTIIKPYFSRKSYLDADVWIQGYEYTRHKVSNYYLHVTNVALLNHVFNILHEKTNRTISMYTVPSEFLNEYKILLDRVHHLEKQTMAILDNFEKVQKKDPIRKKLSALVPIIMKSVLKNLDETKGSNNHSSAEVNLQISSTRNPNSKEVLCIVEKLQWHLMIILQTLDKLPQHHVVERTVRQQLKLRKAKSHKALIQQNRSQNWLQHFRKHHHLQQKEMNKL